MINSSFNWNSPLVSPMFNEGYFNYYDILYYQHLSIIIDIRKVRISEK